MLISPQFTTHFNILESHFMVDIPTNSEDLAHLIYSYSYDWKVVLDFVCAVATARGVKINKHDVSKKIQELVGKL